MAADPMVSMHVHVHAVDRAAGLYRVKVRKSWFRAQLFDALTGRDLLDAEVVVGRGDHDDLAQLVECLLVAVAGSELDA